VPRAREATWTRAASVVDAGVSGGLNWRDVRCGQRDGAEAYPTLAQRLQHPLARRADGRVHVQQALEQDEVRHGEAARVERRDQRGRALEPARACERATQ
jgi:hypothetical protein